MPSYQRDDKVTLPSIDTMDRLYQYYEGERRFFKQAIINRRQAIARRKARDAQIVRRARVVAIVCVIVGIAIAIGSTV